MPKMNADERDALYRQADREFGEKLNHIRPDMAVRLRRFLRSLIFWKRG